MNTDKNAIDEHHLFGESANSRKLFQIRVYLVYPWLNCFFQAQSGNARSTAGKKFRGRNGSGGTAALKWMRRRNNFWKNAPGIPTGVAFDIHKQIERQRAKRAASPDNLAPQPECANTTDPFTDPFRTLSVVKYEGDGPNQRKNRLKICLTNYGTLH